MPASSEAPLKRHLLVIDDEPFVGQVIRMIFEKGPFRVSTAASGEAGLAFLRETPEVIFTFVDINMPGMTGLDVIEAARQEPRLADHPFVVLTAAGDQALVARAQSLGAKAFITKPFSPNKLYRQICDLIDPPGADPVA